MPELLTFTSVKKATAFLAACACLFLASCKPDDEPASPVDLLECPSDPAPVRGFGGLGNVVLPNAFTPNGDGKNDLLRLVMSDTAAVRSVTMRVVDAGGSIIFTFSKKTDAWDGYNKNAGKHFPPGQYRIDYGIVLHGGGGTDAALSGHTCVRLYATDSSGCIIRQGDPNRDVFEDRIDPAAGTWPYATAENFCP
jgi:gliding motility-associated-like protein